MRVESAFSSVRLALSITAWYSPWKNKRIWRRSHSFTTKKIVDITWTAAGKKRGQERKNKQEMCLFVLGTEVNDAPSSRPCNYHAREDADRDVADFRQPNSFLLGSRGIKNKRRIGESHLLDRESRHLILERVTGTKSFHPRETGQSLVVVVDDFWPFPSTFPFRL